MFSLKAWGVATPCDMLDAIKDILLRPNSHYRGGAGYACDRNGAIVPPQSEDAYKWSPAGAWQIVSGNMPVSDRFGYITNHASLLMDAAVRKITNGRFQTVSAYNLTASHGMIIHVLNEAIEMAKVGDTHGY